MSSKSRGKNNLVVKIDTAALSTFHPNYNLLVYTALTFFVVLLIYVATKDWKGFTIPEEVDVSHIADVHRRRCPLAVRHDYYKSITSIMSSRSRGKNNLKVKIDTAALSKFHQSYNLLVYTVLTFFVVFLIYFATKDWKGYTSPEEVDLGAVQVPTHACRRKHAHIRRH